MLVFVRSVESVSRDAERAQRNVWRISSFNTPLVLAILIAVALAKILALFFRQTLVLAPAFAQFLAFLGGQIAQVAVSLTGLRALLRRELRPLAHTRLQALLAFRRHVGIAPGNLKPSLAAFGFEPIPFLLEWCQRFALRGA
jgi:Na+/glutamate symporter